MSRAVMRVSVTVRHLHGNATEIFITEQHSGGEMDGALKELIRLRGIGPVLGRRFLDAGLDGFEKIAEAGEEGLKNIRGLNPRMIPSLLSQVAEMATDAEAARESALREMRQRIDRLAATVRDMAAHVKDRLGPEGVGRHGIRIEKEIFRILVLLDKLTTRLDTKRKRTAKGLDRAEKRLLTLKDAGLTEIEKGLRKSRKSLKRIFA
jgi:hypothetical protein